MLGLLSDSAGVSTDADWSRADLHVLIYVAGLLVLTNVYH